MEDIRRSSPGMYKPPVNNWMFYTFFLPYQLVADFWNHQQFHVNYSALAGPKAFEKLPGLNRKGSFWKNTICQGDLFNFWGCMCLVYSWGVDDAKDPL